MNQNEHPKFLEYNLNMSGNLETTLIILNFIWHPPEFEATSPSPQSEV